VRKLSEGIKGKVSEEEKRRRMMKTLEEMRKREEGKVKPQDDPFGK